MKTIAFHDNNLCLRGTTVAMYDYADYNERILGNKSIIVSQATSNLDALPKFKQRFEHIYLTPLYEYENVLKPHNVDFIYLIKAGSKWDGLCFDNIPSLIHVVFRSNEPHGHRYKYVSDWLAKDQGYDPVDHAVPHMVKKFEGETYDLREKLGISKSKTVFGCYAGATEFNIGDVHAAIKNTVNSRDDIVFLFMNINKFCDPHPNIIHLPGTYDMREKAAFIRACDAMIHARGGGETFGCSVAEFCIENKPVVTCSGSGERSHIEILGDRGIYYNGYEPVYDILNNLKKYAVRDDYYKAYDNYSPEKIMERFNKNFLS